MANIRGVASVETYTTHNITYTNKLELRVITIHGLLQRYGMRKIYANVNYTEVKTGSKNSTLQGSYG